MSQLELSARARQIAEELWTEYYQTVLITARKAQKTWCSQISLPDLLQEGFLCLLSVSGLSRTPGKFEATYEGPRGKAQFKTYFISALHNWYRDKGNEMKKISQINYRRVR